MDNALEEVRRSHIFQPFRMDDRHILRGALNGRRQCRQAGVSEAERTEKALVALDAVGLKPYANNRPVVEKHLGEAWTLEDLLPHVHRVERGLIRVDADEVTYPLHVILRFELEQDLVSGNLEVADLPEAWDARMRDYLGLSTIDNAADGPMQDVHWPSAAFGYFPSYTLGAMMAAQQWAALTREHPAADEDIARGDFDVVNGWRREHIWSQGSRYSTPELLERATGGLMLYLGGLAAVNRRDLDRAALSFEARLAYPRIA